MQRRVIAVFLVAAAYAPFAASACSEAGSPATALDGGNGALPAGSAIASPIGAMGGTVGIGPVSVSIPPGALDHAVMVSIAPIASSFPGLVGQAYEIGPTGTQFKTPIAIAFAYTDAELGGRPPGAFAVSTAVGDAWQALSQPAVGPGASKISGMTTHLSPYALVAQPASADAAGGSEDATAATGSDDAAAAGGSDGATATEGGEDAPEDEAMPPTNACDAAITLPADGSTISACSQCIEEQCMSALSTCQHDCSCASTIGCLVVNGYSFIPCPEAMAAVGAGSAGLTEVTACVVMSCNVCLASD